MKSLIFIFLFNYLFIGYVEASENSYNTKFHSIKISNEFLSDSKNKEIKTIKEISLKNVLKKILNDLNYKKLNRSMNINNEIDFMIKNIIIENEFISSNEYSAEVKVNFNSSSIVNLLRQKKINYSDLESPNILILITNKSKIYEQGITKNNDFYNLFNKSNFGLTNFIYPALSLNDRYILPYEKILSNENKSFQKFSSKYEVNYIFIININNIDNVLYFKISVYDFLQNNFKDILLFDNTTNINYIKFIYKTIDNWWKDKNLIKNSIINKNLCYIKSSNIYELNFINSQITSISQIKSNTLKKIDLGLNLNEIIFYGDLIHLSSAMLKNNIKLNVKENNVCIISIFN